MHPGDVVIRPVDGGFLMEWLEQNEVDQQSPAGLQAMHVGGWMVKRKQAVRATMDEAFSLVEAILKRKQMLLNAGKLDMPAEGMMLGGTQCFPPGGPMIP